MLIEVTCSPLFGPWNIGLDWISFTAVVFRQQWVPRAFLVGQNSSVQLTNTHSGTPTLGSDPWGSLPTLLPRSCTIYIPMGVFLVFQLLSRFLTL